MKLKLTKPKEFDVKDWIVSVLRRASYKTPQYTQAHKQAKTPVPVGYPNKRLKFLYKCQICKFDFPMKETQVDHIIPVVPVTGWTKLPDGKWDFNPIIYNMIEGKLQVVCKPCHKKKSKKENATRRLLNKMMDLMFAKNQNLADWEDTLMNDLFPALGLEKPKKAKKRKVNKTI
jgi:5-methylcytosine-specific restriction endonuclease McrA